MKHTQQLFELSAKLEQKLFKSAQQPTVSQTGTTELFFGDQGKQRSFNAAIQSGILAKFLTDTAIKTQKTASFDLQALAESGKGAAWILKTTPTPLQSTVSKLLDAEFRKIMGKGMGDQLKAAVAGAKSGGGSGLVHVGSFSADMD